MKELLSCNYNVALTVWHSDPMDCPLYTPGCSRGLTGSLRNAFPFTTGLFFPTLPKNDWSF